MTPTSEVAAFDPMPVRQRDTLEILDTALKLYRRYFPVLLAWSLPGHVGSISAIIISAFGQSAPGKSLLGDSVIVWALIVPVILNCFFMPLIIGATACVVAAGVRGQQVTFGQCWKFLKPRYRATRGQYISTAVGSFVGLMAFSMMSFAFFGITVGLASSLQLAPVFVIVTLSVLLLLALSVVGSVVGSALLAWKWMTPLIVCLEDNNRSSNASGRAWSLMAKNWWRITGLISLASLAILVVYAVVSGVLALIMGVPGFIHMFTAQADPATNTEALMLGSTIAVGQIIAAPAFFMVAAVLYLDLRVRHEALDLEWTEHVTNSPVPDSLVQKTTAAASAGSFAGPPQLVTQTGAQTPLFTPEPDSIQVDENGPVELLPGDENEDEKPPLLPTDMPVPVTVELPPPPVQQITEELPPVPEEVEESETPRSSFGRY